MEPNDTSGGLSSYYHHHSNQPPHHHQNHQSPTTVSPSPANGAPPHVVYPHSVPSAVSSPLETVRRKRGRPRKYGTPEQAAAAKRASASSTPVVSSMAISQQQQKKKEQSLAGSIASSSSSSKKTQLASLGNAGQGFTPHIIAVSAGEDVSQKIMLFMQQSKREICILSASGSISNPSLCQPSGGNITYEGRFDILSMCGSYVRTNLGGRTGGLSVSLSSTDGQVIGGGVGGPMNAAGPVQVIVGSFLVDTKKDIDVGVKGDASVTPLVGGVLVSSQGFQTTVDSSRRFPVRGVGDHQIMGGSQFMVQPRGVPVTPSRSSEWWSGNDDRSNATYEFTGRTGHGADQSPENGDYDDIAD